MIPSLGQSSCSVSVGVSVEILKDVAFRLAPLTPRDAQAMIREIKGFALLSGYRGQPAVDLAALEQLLLQVSALVEAQPDIKELDLNPIFAYATGCLAVDARIILHQTTPTTRPASAVSDNASGIGSRVQPQGRCRDWR